MKTWSFHHFHPFWNGCLEFQVYIPTIVAKTCPGQNKKGNLYQSPGIHVWYIYPDLVYFYFIGKYTSLMDPFGRNVFYLTKKSWLLAVVFFSLWKQGVSCFCSLCLKRIVECAVSGWSAMKKVTPKISCGKIQVLKGGISDFSGRIFWRDTQHTDN